MAPKKRAPLSALSALARSLPGVGGQLTPALGPSSGRSLLLRRSQRPHEEGECRRMPPTGAAKHSLQTGYLLAQVARARVCAGMRGARTRARLGAGGGEKKNSEYFNSLWKQPAPLGGCTRLARHGPTPRRWAGQAEDERMREERSTLSHDPKGGVDTLALANPRTARARTENSGSYGLGPTSRDRAGRGPRTLR